MSRNAHDHEHERHREAPRARVIVASDRAAAGTYTDTSGPLLAHGLRELGLRVDEIVIVPDGDPVGLAITEALASGAECIVTTGGTGLGARDLTPEVTAPLLDRLIPGLAEAIRAQGVAAGVPAAMLSRGLAGLAGRSLVINLAGSPGACRDALTVLASVLPHALAQIAGDDH